ncbi:MAG: DUF1016 N-terminal domain-containing protein [Cetobacterium sp.]
MELESRNDIYSEIKNLLENARGKVLSAINSTMTMTYYLIGKRIVEEEQKGDTRAGYGKELIKNISRTLTEEFGKGFTVRNLELIRKFYITYSQDEKTKSLISKSKNPFKLSWTHYIRLVRIENSEERRFYQIEAEKENWTVREMDRHINSCLYDRLALEIKRRLCNFPMWGR